MKLKVNGVSVIYLWLSVILIIVLLISWIYFMFKRYTYLDLGKEQRRKDYYYLSDALIDNNFLPVFLISAKKRLITANDVAYNTFSGLKVGEELGKEFNFVNEFIESDNSKLRKEVVIQNVNYLVSITKIYQKNDFRVLLNLSDITSFKEIDEKNNLFIQNISHEFKTPISAIQGICELLLDDKVQDPKKQHDFLTLIDKENKRLKSIVTRLNKAGLKMPKFERFAIKDLLHEIELFFENTAINKPDVEFKVNTNINYTINQDKNVIMQILINLVSNAFKYTDAGVITVKAEIEGDIVKFIVSDTGPGIDSEELDMIFKRFYRVDNPDLSYTQGMGIGLSIVKELTMNIGGSIEVSSKRKKGSEFTLKVKNI